ncbi:hypothetical protein Aperf_G00000011812 [Anoplocephala perfoliata]
MEFELCDVREMLHVASKNNQGEVEYITLLPELFIVKDYLLSSIMKVSLRKVYAEVFVYLHNSEMQPSKSTVFDFQLNNRSYVRDKKEGIHVSPLIMDGPLADRIEGASTLYDVFKNSVRCQPNAPFLGWHDSLHAPYQWWTYGQVNEKVEACGSGLLEFPELARKSVKCVGIYAVNCPAWKITQLGCWAYGLVVVTLFDALGQEAMTQICKEAELTVVICDNPERAGKLIKSHSAYPELKYIVLISSRRDLEHLRSSAGGDIEVILFDDLLTLGSAKHKPVCPHAADDLAIICYTSGTTGVPKGAMITSGNILPVIAGVQKLIGSMYLTYVGARIGFYSGNIATLSDDMRALRPTIFFAVPRVLCRIFDSVYQEAAKSPFKQFLLSSALRHKRNQIDK